MELEASHRSTGCSLALAPAIAIAAAVTGCVQHIWQYIRASWLSNRVFETYADIVDAACEAWNKLTDQPTVITSIGLRDWAHIGQTCGPLV